MSSWKVWNDHVTKSVLAWKFGDTEDIVIALFSRFVAFPGILYFIALWVLKGLLWAREGFSSEA